MLENVSYGTAESFDYESIITVGVDVYIMEYYDVAADQRSLFNSNLAGVD